MEDCSMRTLCFLLALSLYSFSSTGQDRPHISWPRISYMTDIPEGLWMPLVDHIEGELNALSTQRGLTTTITRESIPDRFLFPSFAALLTRPGHLLAISIVVYQANYEFEVHEDIAFSSALSSALSSFATDLSVRVINIAYFGPKNLVELHYNLGRGETLYFVGSCDFSSRWSLAEEIATDDDPYLIVDYVVPNCHHNLNYLPNNIPLPNGGHGAVVGIFSFSHNDLRELMIPLDALDHFDKFKHAQ